MDDSENTDLKPANDNPWYCLATVYGEQTGDLIDDDLAKKNRTAWNRWVARGLNEEKRTALIENGFDEAELMRFSEVEADEHNAAFLKRANPKVIMPLWPLDPPDLRSIRFDNFVYFDQYLFPFGVSVESSTFSKGAYFRSAIFRGNADFKSVTFSERADFKSAIFNGHANFEFSTFSAIANFKFAKFDLDVNFIDTKFLSVTAFSYMVFRGAVPKFFGATLHEGTAWHGINWPLPTPDLIYIRQKNDAAQEQVYAYERLKQEMEKLKKHEDEQFFFRKELRARRQLSIRGSTYWGLNFLYEKLSNYGYGVVRPLVAFATLFLVGFALLALDPLGFAGKKLTAWDAAFTSLANMFGSLPLKTLAHYTTNETFAYSAEIFAIFQTIAGAVLLFLFFLALRNRFRLR